MAIIDAKVEINASQDAVWDLVSDMDNEPRFWKGTKSVRNISQNGNTITREVVIAFRDQKCLQTVTLVPKEQVIAEFTKGIIAGKKTITITPDGSRCTLHTNWDIKMTGVMGMFTGMVKKHIRNGTQQAMQNIKKELEG